MAYVTPGTVAAGDVATAAAWNVLTNDVIDHETRILSAAKTIQTITLTTAGAITFSSIPQTFSHLQIFYRVRVAKAVGPHALCIRLNADSGANYSFNFTRTNNATVSGGVTIGTSLPVVGIVGGAGATAGYFGAGIINIVSYANTSYQKHYNASSDLFDTSNALCFVQLTGGLYTSTSAITEISLLDDSGTNSHAIGSTATLIGIA